MKKKILFILILFPILLSSCNLKRSITNSTTEHVKEKIPIEEARRRTALYYAIRTDQTDEIKGYLEEGYDPNKSLGEYYGDSNPLNVVSRNLYNTYTRFSSGREIPDPPPDVAILQLLIKAGADVNERPYIWCQVFTWNNLFLELKAERKNLSRTGMPPSTNAQWEEYNNEKIIEPIYFINDANRVLEALLKAGADPNKKGHPYPYSHDGRKVTDEEANEYFAKGTKPINEAIKKGMRWESQVDLLLQYTTLDEDSLKAAKDSKDQGMIEKITDLWNAQRGKNVSN